MLTEYAPCQTRYESVLKNVPLESEEQYAAVRKLVHARCKSLNEDHSFVKMTPRFVFRGKRESFTCRWSNKKTYEASTRKKNARAFDVYIDVKVTSKFMNFNYAQYCEISKNARDRFLNQL